ncbi:MAG: hypothetical protein MUE32_02300 [Bacteroidales bacterium]|jgi:hypothetical protein|nr:hypothetical protein [Bacteroidales bacterium]
MEKMHFPLGTREQGKIAGLARIVFGITCLAVAVYWTVQYGKISSGGYSVIATLVFLFLFAFYMVWAGLGKAYRFIEISNQEIRLKKDIFFSTETLISADLSKIVLYPMTLVFMLKNGRKILLRFGATFHETNEQIKDSILEFAEVNNIETEFVEEKL